MSKEEIIKDFLSKGIIETITAHGWIGYVYSSMQKYADQETKALRKEIKSKEFFKKRFTDVIITALEKDVAELKKENEELKGIEQANSTHRCSCCEDFYANEENPLGEYNGNICCDSCLLDILKEENDSKH